MPKKYIKPYSLGTVACVEEAVTQEAPVGVLGWDAGLQLSPASAFLLKWGFRVFKEQNKADQKLIPHPSDRKWKSPAETLQVSFQLRKKKNQ